ncbi:MAG: hypothetical protein R3D26_08120 [Cyanobacteriota/Melainabacteria group bacterium]
MPVKTRTMLEHKLDQIIPDNINLVHGPDVWRQATPLSKIDKVIESPSRTMWFSACSGELLRLKGSRVDLLEIVRRS